MVGMKLSQCVVLSTYPMPRDYKPNLRDTAIQSDTYLWGDEQGGVVYIAVGWVSWRGRFLLKG